MWRSVGHHCETWLFESSLPLFDAPSKKGGPPIDKTVYFIGKMEFTTAVKLSGITEYGQQLGGDDSVDLLRRLNYKIVEIWTVVDMYKSAITTCHLDESEQPLEPVEKEALDIEMTVDMTDESEEWPTEEVLTSLTEEDFARFNQDEYVQLYLHMS